MSTLLIVDDSKVSRMVIHAHISKHHPDWTFCEASSAAEALACVETAQPDFCTMDINMPGMLGTDAAELLLSRYPHMRIAIFSANVQESMQQRATTIGCRFVAKPVTEKSIQQVLAHFAGTP